MKIRIIVDDILNNKGIVNYENISAKELLSSIKNKYKCSTYVGQKVIDKIYEMSI